MASARTFVADLHIHSYLSRATSKQCDLPHLALWAQRKGIRLLATGDFTHPEWFARIEEDLIPNDDGLFRLRPELAREVSAQVPAACQSPVDFVLQVEISSIYKRGGAVRKVHNLVYLPDLQAARKLCEALGRIGNIGSDGRPILGLDSRDLLEIVLGCSDRAHLIPAHIWTPWFSVFGSKSGFDSLEECYGDLTDHIFALETGLSSDPPMNWRLRQLDGLTLVSNSDAHSPSKLGREANLFHTAVTYDDVFGALRSGDPTRCGGTLEFYPEEGKYHLDGCRRCGVRLSPTETREHGGRCPECGKLITVGVMSRVDELADRAPGGRPDSALDFASLVPLQEVLGECFKQGAATKRVQREYDRLLGELGPELAILRTLPVEALRISSSPLLGEAIRRMRAGELHIQAGYDGEFGKVALFGSDERDRLLGQADLFPAAELPTPTAQTAPASPARQPDVVLLSEAQLGLFGESAPSCLAAPLEERAEDGPLSGLSDEQRGAVCHEGGPLLIVAGPGAGKTRTLTRWLAYRIQVGGVPADAALAVTFTNRAAQELRERLAALLGAAAAAVTVSTFHGLGLALLRRHAVTAGLPPELVVLDERAAVEAFGLELGEAPSASLRKRVQRVGVAKLAQAAPETPELAEDRERYRAALQRRGGVDYADLILLPRMFLAQHPELAAREAERWACIAVDEYQDIDPEQRDLLRLLCGAETALCAIGDPDQSIYGFRGADVSLFTGFGQDFQGVRRAVLSRSYRSTPAILKLAHEVVRHTPDFGRVQIESLVAPADPAAVELHLFPSVAAEAVAVSKLVEELVGGVRSLTDASARERDGGLGFGDIAVLARTGARLEAVAQAFGAVGIPVERVGLTPADADDELAAVALLRLSVGRETPADLLRLLARDDVTRARLTGLLPELAAGTLGAALRDGLPVLTASGRARKALDTLGAHVMELLEGGQGSDLEARVALSRAAACLALRWPPEPGSRALTRLWAMAEAEGTTLGTLLDQRDLQTPADAYDARAERVALLTIHAAKGLEFEAVFVVGCEDGTLPWIPDGRDEPESAPEERRLLYVAMTRARQRLWLGAARKIRRYGTTREVPPSRFLSTVSPSLLRVVEQRRPRKTHQRSLAF